MTQTFVGIMLQRFEPSGVTVRQENLMKGNENLMNSQFSSIDELNVDKCLDSSKVILVQ